MEKNALITTLNLEELNRRHFLHLTGLGVAGLVLPTYGISCNSFDQPHSAKLSMQLYTVRGELAKDIPGTLKRIADIGYKYVETAFWPEGVTLSDAAKYIQDAGLSVSSSHIEIPVGESKKVMLETAKAFKNENMIWHGWPEDKRYSTVAGTMELIKIYNQASRFARENGLKFGLHNHWWEYRNKFDGMYVYELLHKELDEDIFFEVDTYWVKVAGQDPATIINKLGKRVKLLHVKDGPAKWNDNLPEDNPDPMTAIGKGTQDFKAIFKESKHVTEWLVVEMDKTSTDVFQVLKESYDYMIQNKITSKY